MKFCRHKNSRGEGDVLKTTIITINERIIEVGVNSNFKIIK